MVSTHDKKNISIFLGAKFDQIKTRVYWSESIGFGFKKYELPIKGKRWFSFLDKLNGKRSKVSRAALDSILNIQIIIKAKLAMYRRSRQHVGVCPREKVIHTIGVGFF